MSEIQDDTILNSHTICISGHKIFIVMPLMDAGSLQSILSFKYPSGIKDEAIIATILREILRAINILNENHLFHRDIKAANIILSMDGTIRGFRSFSNTKKRLQEKFTCGIILLDGTRSNKTGRLRYQSIKYFNFGYRLIFGQWV